MNEYFSWAWLRHVPHLDFDGAFSGGIIDAGFVLLEEHGRDQCE